MMLAILIISIVLMKNVDALRNAEKRRFKARTHEEQNTGLQGTISITTANGVHTLVSNGIPDHDTGIYPSRGKPNSIVEQNYVYQFRRRPKVADVPTDLNQGPIGFAINGIPFYNPWTNDGRDAVDAETFDVCDGHPDGQDRYHYHKIPTCILTEIEDGVPSPCIGVALDGFPIYGPIDEYGVRLNSTHLDACNGRFAESGQYQYHVTEDYPYVIGCYVGEMN